MPAGGYLLVGFVCGALLGLLIGWLYGRSRAVPDDRLANELRQQLAARDGDLAKLREETRSEASARAAAEASRLAADARFKEAQDAVRGAQARYEEIRESLSGVQSEFSAAMAQLRAKEKALSDREEEHRNVRRDLEQAQGELLNQRNLNGKLSAQVKFLEERLAAERAQIEGLQRKFAQEFEGIANKLLVENSSRFGQQSAESLDKLLGPLRENLQDFKARLENVHQATVTHSTLLKDQIGRIGTEAANLSKALKGDVKVLGNWGENMLDLILEKSGLQLGVHYRRQPVGEDAEGDTRFLDVVIDLPESKHLVIDSKVSLKAYEEHVNASDPVSQGKCLENHIESIRTHFKGLGAKRYQDTLGIITPDFVLMYIPIEAAFFAAIGQEPGLFSEALDRDVVLTTNSTLLATLRTVAHVWRLADQQKYALEIADRGGKLYDKFVGFIEDLDGIGRSLEASQKLLGEARKKLNTGGGNLVGQVEKLKMLGVKASKSIPPEMLGEAESTTAVPGNGGKELLSSGVEN